MESLGPTKTSFDLQRYGSILCLLGLGLTWGSGYVIAKYATTHQVPPLGYSFWQALGPACLLSFWLYPINWLGLLKQHKLFFLVCGLLGIALPNSTMYMAAPHLPAGLLAVIVNTVPIFTYVLALFLKQEPFSLGRLLGVSLGLLGIMLLLWPNVDWLDQPAWYWTGLSFMTPLCFASCAIFIHRYRPLFTNALIQSAGMLWVAACFLTPWVYFTGQFYWFHFPLQTTDWLILLEILLSSIGYVLFFVLIRLAGPTFYSLVSGMVCLTGLWWGWLLYDEQLKGEDWLAIGFILYAIILIAPKPMRKPLPSV